MASYKARLDKSGVMASIYNSNSIRVDVDVTDKYGFYEFKNLVTGPYLIKFYGMGYSSDDNINISIVDEFDAEDTAPLTFQTPPALGVTEGNPFSGQQGEGSEGIFAFSNLQPSTGILGKVDIFYKLSSSSDYNVLFSLSIGDDTPGYDKANGLLETDFPIELVDKPSTYDFKVFFFNPSSEPALNSSNDTITADDTSITFNGIPDLDEYIGVTGVEVSNSNAAGTKVPTNEIIVTWDDMSNESAGTYEDASGSSVTVSENQLKNISSYIVYMYVSAGTSPPSNGENYPNKTETNGEWYMLDTIHSSQQRASLRVPQQKSVMLWIGFLTGGTSSSTTSNEYNF